mgnify:CR=1 FL=1
MKRKAQDYASYREEWLERDAAKEWVLSRPGVIAMLEHVEELIGSVQGLNVLDAGCKEGWTGEYLLQNKQAGRVTSIELLDKFVQYAQNLGRTHVIQGDVCCMDAAWEQQFDLVICRHVLGLVQNAEQAVRELHRVSKRWVYLITHIPGNEKKHYSLLERPNTLLSWVDDMKFHVRFFAANPKQFRYKDAHRVEYVLLTERRVTAGEPS